MNAPEASMHSQRATFSTVLLLALCAVLLTKGATGKAHIIIFVYLC